METGADILSYAALVGGIVLLLAGLALGAVAMAAAPSRGLAVRLRQFSRDYRDGGVGGDTAAAGFAHMSPRDLLINGLEAAAQALGGFNVIGEKQRAQFQGLLVRAGIRRADGLRLLVTIKVMGMVIAGAGGALGALAFGASMRVMIPMLVAGALVGSLGPEKVLTMRAKKRQRQIALRLPDALDLLIIFANAGYGLDQAIRQLSVEMRRSAPDLSEELAVTSDELRLLNDRAQALENLAIRTDQQCVRVLVSALVQSQKYGTPLSQALRVLASELRGAQILEIEEKAARMPVLITVPLILLILPALFMVVATPAYIQVKSVWPTQNGAPPPARR